MGSLRHTWLCQDLNPHPLDTACEPSLHHYPYFLLRPHWFVCYSFLSVLGLFSSYLSRLPPFSSSLSPSPGESPGPLLSWQENKGSWQWEKSVKENMSTVVVMALLSENSLCQGAALASHTCSMDRCFQLLSLTSLQARILSDWLLLNSEGNKGNWG